MSDIRYIDKDFVSFKFKGFDGTEKKAILVFGDKGRGSGRRRGIEAEFDPCAGTVRRNDSGNS
ncbi:MAG: hypothetical protein IPK58_25755 [Acidobacteria bacterium]|nr:hypothetical protein [Acidobacteriota bacterium]